MSCWDLLGVPEGSDIYTIKKAYAKLLKKCHPEDDAEGYQELREAYNKAKKHTPEKNKHVSPIAYTNIQYRIFKRILPSKTKKYANNSIIKKVQAIKQEPFIFSLDFMFQLGKGKL